jgi:hypothetical protein
MNDRMFYYIRVTSGKYTDGNDVLWIGNDGKNTYNLDEAKIYTAEQAKVFIDYDGDFEAHPVHQIDKLVQYHAPVRSFRKDSKIPEGTLCYILSKRDTCGTNATFWAWNHLGYVSDPRNAQIFVFKHDRYSRDFEFYVPIEKVKKKLRKRIDIQDLRAGRTVSHVLTYDYFKEDKKEVV